PASEAAGSVEGLHPVHGSPGLGSSSPGKPSANRDTGAKGFELRNSANKQVVRRIVCVEPLARFAYALLVAPLANGGNGEGTVTKRGKRRPTVTKREKPATVKRSKR